MATARPADRRHAPERDRGRLLAAASLTRYRWAAGVAPNRQVLDAGCGSGEGARLLAAAGAEEVIALDRAADVLAELAGPDDMPALTVRSGDVRDTGLADDHCELVVCFGVLDELEDPLTALDELVRVLAPGGLVMVSTVAGGALGSADGLRAALAERLPQVAVAHQTEHLLSALLPDGATLDGATLHAGEDDAAPGTSSVTIAVATDGTLPELGALAETTDPAGLRDWLDALEDRTRMLHERDSRIAELEARLAEGATLGAQLLDAEQTLARIPDLELRIVELQDALRAAQDAAASARENASELDERLMGAERVLADVLGSPSWQVTKPLRAAKKILR